MVPAHRDRRHRSGSEWGSASAYEHDFRRRSAVRPDAAGVERAGCRCRQGARRRSQRRDDRARRPRLRAARLLRLRHRDAEHRPARRRRPALQPLPRHRAVLADAGLPPDRPQPPRGRHGLPHRHPAAPSRVHRPDPDLGGDAAACAARRRATTRSRVGKWHLAPRGERTASGPFDRWPLGSASSATTASSRATPTSGRRTSCATTTTSSRPVARRTATTSPRTSPTRRSARSPTSSRPRPASPFFLYFATGAHARAAPGAARVDRPLPRAVRRRLGRVAGTHLRPPTGAGRRARRRGLHARARAWVAGVGRALRRRAAPLRAPCRRCSPASSAHTDAQIGRVISSLDELGVLDDTLVDAHLRQRRERRGRRARHVQRAPRSRSALPDDRRGQPRAASTSSAASARTPTTRGAGRGPATRRCGCGSATRGSAAPARR